MGKFILSNDAKRLLRRVRYAILKEPQKYNQKNWCGTSCCIAGHIAILGLKDGDIDKINANDKCVYKNGEFVGTISQYAQNKLGLTDRLANSLFLTPGSSAMQKNSGWNIFEKEFNESTTQLIWQNNHKPHAKLGAKRIDYFIEHNR